MKFITFIALGFLPWLSTSAQDTKRSYESLQQSLQPDQVVTYKTVGDRELTLHLFYPENYKPSDRRPAFVTIHGGGWTNGTPRRFYPYANAMAEKGFLGISVEYRLFNTRKGITVFDCVKDGRAAVRYIRANAKSLGIDPRSIAVSGGSAGGHVAAGTALFDGIDHADEDPSKSCRPDALVLFFPVIDTSEKGYGMKKIGDQWATISPVDQIKAGAPPTLIFHGDADTTTPYAGAKQFTERMQAAGHTCELVTHPGGGHGYLSQDIKLFDDTMQKTAAFLTLHLGE